MITSAFMPPLALARGTTDRAGHRRSDAEWLGARWNDATSRVLIVSDGNVAIAGDPPALVLVAPTALPDTAPELRWFLGLDGNGVAMFAAPGDLPDRGTRANLRQVGALLADRDAGLMTTAVALDAWHTTHHQRGGNGSRVPGRRVVAPSAGRPRGHHDRRGRR
jgi:NAD+ diphosphatase